MEARRPKAIPGAPVTRLLRRVALVAGGFLAGMAGMRGHYMVLGLALGCCAVLLWTGYSRERP